MTGRAVGDAPVALLSWADVTVTEQRLCEAADGQLLNLTTERVDEDDPARTQDWDSRRIIRGCCSASREDERPGALRTTRLEAADD